MAWQSCSLFAQMPVACKTASTLPRGCCSSNGVDQIVGEMPARVVVVGVDRVRHVCVEVVVSKGKDLAVPMLSI